MGAHTLCRSRRPVARGEQKGFVVDIAEVAELVNSRCALWVTWTL